MPRCSHAAWLAAGTVSSASAKGANAGRTARPATRDRLRGDSTTFLLWRLEQHVAPGAADRARGERGHGLDRGGDATHRVAPARPGKGGPDTNVVPTLAGPARAPRARGRRVQTAERASSALQRRDPVPGNVRGRRPRLTRVVRQPGDSHEYGRAHHGQHSRPGGALPGGRDDPYVGRSRAALAHGPRVSLPQLLGEIDRQLGRVTPAVPTPRAPVSDRPGPPVTGAAVYPS